MASRRTSKLAASFGTMAGGGLALHGYSSLRRKCHDKISRSGRGHGLRSQRGVLMPFLAVCVILLMGTAGIATDMMRNFQAVRELKYAAQATALYALSLSSSAAGNFSQSAVQAAIVSPTTSWSNNAQIGPNQSNGPWTAPVLFSDGDISFVPNPADNSESFLQLTARRQGATSLAQFFLPLLFTGLNSALPQSVRTFATAQTVEVLGQPATRIGAGPPPGNLTSARAMDLYGYAALPLAISSQQFAAIVAANQGATGIPCTLDLVSSTNPKALAGHIPAAFINLTATAGGVTNYAVAQGQLAQTQLQSLLSYFSTTASNSPSSANPPGAVECGGQVSAYDPADPSFSAGNNQAQLVALVNSLPPRTYILPVIAGSQPLLAGVKTPNVLNTVVGFAYVQWPKQNLGAQPFALSLTFVPSPPLRNASSAAGLASWPLGTSNLMPAPAFPFLPRAFDPASGGVTARLCGVALAPALSPRAN